MSFRPPKGTFDVIAGSSQPISDPGAWRELLSTWEDWVRRFGYPLVMTPVFEATELFERGVGDTTEVVTKQMYTFTDKGGRSITLRPEATAGVVRAYLDSGAQGAWKGAYSGPMFRYERPQKGRYRQFFQVGVEYLDVESSTADAEVIELGFRYLEAVGVDNLELRVNSLGDKMCRPGYLKELRSYLNDHLDDLCDESRPLAEANPLRVLDCKVCSPQLGDAPMITDHLCRSCAEHYAEVKAILKDLAVPFIEDPRLVRGLDYYTRTAFEYIAVGLDAAQNAVGGGGRYDGLAESIGGRPTPGIGFSLGIDRIILAREGRPGPELDIFLVSEAPPSEALLAARVLRDHGLRVDFDAQGRSVKAQFRAATRSGAPATVVFKGDGEPADVRVGGARVEMPLEEVAAWMGGAGR
jgi:histidyl-tRNA synthetase